MTRLGAQMPVRPELVPSRLGIVCNDPTLLQERLLVAPPLLLDQEKAYQWAYNTNDWGAVTIGEPRDRQRWKRRSQ